MPTMPATFSVPARRLRSCLPPVSGGMQPDAPADPQRADALRAVELVRRDREQVHAERLDVDRDLARRLHRVGVEQRAARRGPVAASSAIGWMVPISLLACMTDTSAVSSVSAVAQRRRATRCRSASTGRSVVVQPRRASALRVLRTASCSMALAIRCLRPVGSSASATPRMAKLSPSVPPPVNTISDGSAPMQRRHLRSRLVEGRLGPLPEVVDARRVAELLPEHGAHAVDDGRGGGVVALWSR